MYHNVELRRSFELALENRLHRILNGCKGTYIGDLTFENVICNGDLNDEKGE